MGCVLLGDLGVLGGELFEFRFSLCLCVSVVNAASTIPTPGS